MRVDGLISPTSAAGQIKKDQAPEQVANVAFLPASSTPPGHAGYHWGYGFCMAAFAR